MSMGSISLETNMLSIVMQNNLAKTNKALASSMEKLSTGKKINSAADGAAQLAISTKLSAQISGTTVAKDNTEQGISMLNQTDADLQTINKSLNKIRDLAVQASNGTYTQEQRNAMAVEAQGYVDQINNLAASSSFNGIKLLDGSTTDLTLQIGANSGDTMDISSAFVDSSGSALGLTSSVITTAFSSAENANAFISTVDSAISTTNSHLSTVGSYANSLSSTLDSLAVQQTNLEASQSTLIDVDYAKEVSNYTKLQILQQIDASLLAQANTQPALAYTLLGINS